MRPGPFVPWFLAFAIAGHASVASAQAHPHGRFLLTEYWVAAESAQPRDHRAVRVVDRAGATVTWVCERFAESLAMEGTGRTWDGRLLNWDTRRNGRACYAEMDTALFPYGAGVRGYALVPYRSIAVDARYIPLGHTVEIAELMGAPLPDGSRHDGCLVAVDGGGAIRGHHIDLFMPSRDAYVSLDSGGWLPRSAHVVVDAPRCDYARRFAIVPVPGDVAVR